MEPVVTAQDIIDHLSSKNLEGQPFYASRLRHIVIGIIMTAESQIVEMRATAQPAPPPRPTRGAQFQAGFKHGMGLFSWTQHLFRGLLWILVVWCMAWTADIPRDGKILLVCWVSAVFSDWIDAMMLAHNDEKAKKRGP